MREEIIGSARLILGDCLEILPTLTGIDHIISDPPYEDELHAAVGKIARLRNDGQEMVDHFGFDGINASRQAGAGHVRLILAPNRERVQAMPDHNLSTNAPVFHADFEAARRTFMTAFAAFMGNSAVPAHIREAEYLGTVSALTQIAVLSGVKSHA